MYVTQTHVTQTLMYVTQTHVYNYGDCVKLVAYS